MSPTSLTYVSFSLSSHVSYDICLLKKNKKEKKGGIYMAAIAVALHLCGTMPIILDDNLVS